jgi:hypothetical protein
MTTASLTELQALQDADGCFPSYVDSADGRAVDRNGYVAALVLRTLRHHPMTEEWSAITATALDWLEACRSPRLPAAFAFWPEHARPAWAARVPADVDDTAVMLTELLRHGRVARVAAVRCVCTVLTACRLEAPPHWVLPPWVTPGSYLTWVTADAHPTGGRTPPNPVDACANANVVALLSLLDATHLPGHDAAARTVTRGLAWAGDDPRRLAALSPFYPSPRSLAEAVTHAVECGSEALREAADRVSELPPTLLLDDAGACRSAYGQTVWHAPALDIARAVAEHALAEREPAQERRST